MTHWPAASKTHGLQSQNDKELNSANKLNELRRRSRTPGKTTGSTNSLTTALQDPEERTQLSRTQTSDLPKLR